jgi:hypothetical protein
MLMGQNLLAQKVQTIVPLQPVVVGTAFQVQYIITQPGELANTVLPAFDSFRVVSGPNHYKGNALIDGKQQPIENITFTLVPSSTGTITINGLKASFKNGSEQEGASATITVIPQPRVSFIARSSYTDLALYAPRSQADLQKMVGENLFLKAELSKTKCYVGEPVVATFTLYSRLQSSSELVRTPGLYGFSVMDMLNTREAHQQVETIRGKVFNTSILRKVQLYPEQPGQLVVDEMVVQNEIDFDDSLGGNTRISKELRSRPMAITVLPLPEKKPAQYNGAVGRFSLSSHLIQDTIARQAEGKLVVTVKGNGNFIQLNEPIVPWPAHFDVFEPVVNDALDRNAIPVKGSRDYIFSFTVSKAGTYILPPIEFSFFDLITHAYKNVLTDSMQVYISETGTTGAGSNVEKVKKEANFNWLLALGLLVIISFLAFLAWPKIRDRKKSKKATPTEIKKPELFIDLSGMNDKEACQQVQHVLDRILKHYELTQMQKREVVSLRRDCQLLVYSEVSAPAQRTEIEKRLTALVQDVEGGSNVPVSRNI